MFHELRKWLKNYDSRMARRRERSVKENRADQFALQYDIDFVSARRLIDSGIDDIKKGIQQLRKIEKRYNAQLELDLPPKNKIAGRNNLLPNRL